MDNMVAYNPPQSLWKLIEDHISPHENEEIRRMLGESLIEQSIDLHQEVELLLDIWRSVREESESKPKPLELPEPPEMRDRLIKEILFFIDGVKEKATLNGFDPDQVVSGYNKDVISYALKTQSTGSRPGTPRSSTDSGRETPMIPSDKRLYEETEVKRDVISMNDKLNFLQFDQVVASLRNHLETEVEQLLNDITYIQQCIDTETALPGSDLVIDREPTLTELKEERSLLEKELIPDLQVKPRNHVASLSSKSRPNLHIASKPSPMKASHSICSTVSNLPQLPHKKLLHEQLRYKPGANASRLKVVPVSKVIDRYGECSRFKLTPSPPASDRSVTPERPGSAARFRRMVLECREGD